MIFYFSGTGNSQYLAQRLAKASGDEMMAVPRAMKDGAFAFECECAGFVFPVYYWGVPDMVKRFVERLELTGTKYVYLAMTCGSDSGNAESVFRKLLAQRGITLNAVFCVVMTDNYVPAFSIPSMEKAKERLMRAEPAIEALCAGVAAQKTPMHSKNRGWFPRTKTALIYPMYEKARSTKRFYVTSACTGCGLCWCICPEEAIKITNDMPRWVKSKCTHCLACLHHCPSEAIQYGRATEKRRRYINPNTTLHF